MKVCELFNKIKNFVQKQRKLNPRFDGLGFWQPIKNILDRVHLENYQKIEWRVYWKKPLLKRDMEILKLEEYIVDKDGKKTINEKNHFIIQTIRIPSSEPASIKKLIQVALNIGQYKGVKKRIDISLPYENIEDFVIKKIAESEIILIKEDEKFLNQIL
jgi:hypothetical protein